LTRFYFFHDDRYDGIPFQLDMEISIGNFLITVKEMDGNRIREYIVCQTEVETPEEASST